MRYFFAVNVIVIHPCMQHSTISSASTSSLTAMALISYPASHSAVAVLCAVTVRYPVALLILLYIVIHLSVIQCLPSAVRRCVLS